MQFTPEELEALPIGPDVFKERELTREEVEAGFAELPHGRAKILGGTKVAWLEMREVRITSFEPDDPIFYFDRFGERWTIGEWADGTKFRQPFYI